MTFSLAGIFAPVITPFRGANEDLDVEGFKANLKAHMADGLDGVVVAGSTGEAALLDESERGVLAAAAREVVPRDKRVIIGTGAESARQCLVRCKQAKDAGADAVLVVAPHYYSNAMSREALATHYQRVADGSPLPVMLYNIPKYMHFALPADLVAELAQHKNVVGIKDSSGDVNMLKGFLAAQSDSFSVITGSGSTLQPALEAGARGGILAVSLFAAALSREVLAAVRAGDTARATAAQARLKVMADVIVAKLGVPGVKAAMDQVGRVGGAPRVPLLPLSEAQRGEMQAVMA
jgi:4-hydroxy-2-oxoglutarate aldolase